MSELKFLDQSFVASLTKLLEAQRTSQAEMLKRNAQHFAARGPEALAVAVIGSDRATVEQAVLTFFQRPSKNHDYLAVSTAVSGNGALSSALFNSLCAACSSATPVVTCHLVISSAQLASTVAKAWQGSRLGRFTVGSKALTLDEVSELLGPGLTALDATQKVTLYSVQYPTEAGLQPTKGSDTIRRCKYC